VVYGAMKTMNTTRERWIVEWDRDDPERLRSPVSTAFFKREHVRRHLSKLQEDPNAIWVSVSRVVPVVRWERGAGSAIEQLDAFPIDEVEPVWWNVVWVTPAYLGRPYPPPNTRFRYRESLRQRLSELEQRDYVIHIYVTHRANVLRSSVRSAEDTVEMFDAFIQRSSLPESHQPGLKPED